MALANRGDVGARVDVWFGVFGSGGASRVAGPRAVQIRLEAGATTSAAIGPVFATLDSDTIVQLVAQCDPGAEIWVTEGTDLLNRAGATALLLWGGTAAFPGPPP